MSKIKIGMRFVWRKHNRSGFLTAAKIVEATKVNSDGTFEVSKLRNNTFLDRKWDCIPPYKKGTGALHKLIDETPETLAAEIEDSKLKRAALWARKVQRRKARSWRYQD